jgi:5-methylcytosine-specific restriction protein B
MTLDELAKILADMYANAERGETAMMVHLFGIRYAHEIREHRYSPAAIIDRARQLPTEPKITAAFQVEINKGVNLARYVIEKQTVIDFIHKTGIN